MRKIFILVLLLLGSSVSAQEILEKTAMGYSDFWPEGLHIYSGAGVNFSSIESANQRINLGAGSNFKTDVSYFFSEKWAAEASASVKFNKYKVLIWDTHLTVGMRYRFREPSHGEYGEYIRGFVGSGPLVVYLDHDTALALGDSDADRIHFEGPVIGLGFGHIRRLESGRPWFFEANISAQHLNYRDDVKMDGATPVVLHRESVKDDSNIYTVCLVLGIMIF